VIVSIGMAVIALSAAAAYTAFALRSTRVGYRKVVFVEILGTFGSISIPVVLGIISFRMAAYAIFCITLTAIIITRGQPFDLFELEMIYGPDDEEAAVHDKGIWRKQALYCAILLVEATPVIVWSIK